MGPDPAVAQVRLAVRKALATLAAPAGGVSRPLVLVACSGGQDSLALAAATAAEAPRAGLAAGGVTVDHRLQPGSDTQAARVAHTLAGLGLDPVLTETVSADGPGGPEAAARAARYAALDGAAGRLGAVAVLLGHTLDDQAETVLLGLARGSGARSLAGMAPVSGRYLRPLLGVRREVTAAACAAEGLPAWADPHNQDPSYTRARVRHQALPALAGALGPGVAEALARTADLLRADNEVLDQLAVIQKERLTDADGGLDAAGLAALPEAIRTRVLHQAAAEAGCPRGALSARHVASLAGLVTGWHGQRWADLPGGIRGTRRYGKLLCSAPARAEQADGTANAEGAGGRD
ncbi:MAG TPA: tRNA lysidine(34) synthetase TilS [Streptosporangiaceae bacterium]|nr:tRNA lysidine(34) synthetase TilS [Streptosporangiaceae bacterium]